MTAPDALTRPISRPCSTNPSVAISLERQINPDHLALLAADEWGLFTERDVVVTLASPALPSDGVAALLDGACDMAVIEAVRLVEAAAADIEPLGCILRRKVAVLMREDRLRAFRDGDLLRIAVPLAEPLVDRACRRILQGWAAHQGVAVAGETICVEPVGLPAIEALVAGYDGAWVTLRSEEDAAARLRGLAVRPITAEEGGLSEVSGLELVARRQRSREERARHESVFAAIEEAAARLQADPDMAFALWQRYGRGGEGDVEQVVRATVPGLCAPIDRSPGRWRALQSLA